MLGTCTAKGGWLDCGRHLRTRPAAARPALLRRRLPVHCQAAISSAAHAAPPAPLQEVPQPTVDRGSSRNWSTSRAQFKPLNTKPALPLVEQPIAAAARPLESVASQPMVPEAAGSSSRPSWVHMHLQVLTYLGAAAAVVGAAAVAAFGVR